VRAWKLGYRARSFASRRSGCHHRASRRHRSAEGRPASHSARESATTARRVAGFAYGDRHPWSTPTCDGRSPGDDSFAARAEPPMASELSPQWRLCCPPTSKVPGSNLARGAVDSGRSFVPHGTRRGNAPGEVCAWRAPATPYVGVRRCVGKSSRVPTASAGSHPRRAAGLGCPGGSRRTRHGQAMPQLAPGLAGLIARGLVAGSPSRGYELRILMVPDPPVALSPRGWTWACRTA
jgi:hypothetical protein